MKKLIFLMLVLLAGHFSYAQTPKWRFINNTLCDIRVKVHCFDICVPITSYGPIIVPRSTSNRLLDKCATGSPVSTVFEICWASGCGGACVYVVGPGAGATCGLAPVGTSLPNCGACGGAANIIVNPMNNTVTIN